MFFGSVRLAEAGGAILAHSETLASGRLPKGHLLGPADLAALAAEGRSHVTIARPGPEDVSEDAAAECLARALLPDPAAAGFELTPPHAGRVNLRATGPGVLLAEPEAVHALNRLNPAITLATLAPFARLGAGQLAATVKIIDYAVPRADLDRAEALLRGAAPVLRRAPVIRRSAALVMTEVPGQAAKLTEKGARAVGKRLAALGIPLAARRTVPHDRTAIAGALSALAPRAELLLILTGSATSDLRDDAPEGLRLAGGRVARFGMPVDPGNLLFHGDLAGCPVIGLPGCARSPALNGADWVLERLACGLAVSDEDIAMMGLGGLLKEIPLRPHPRESRAAG